MIPNNMYNNKALLLFKKTKCKIQYLLLMGESHLTFARKAIFFVKTNKTKLARAALWKFFQIQGILKIFEVPGSGSFLDPDPLMPVA